MAVNELNSNASQIYSVNMDPVGDAYRGFLSSDFNGKAIAAEDWQRSEQSANNQYYRDLALQENANAFSASEAQKNRDWQEALAAKQYQVAVEDMKKAGLNPVLMYGNSSGGAEIGSGAQATASNARSGGSNYRGDSGAGSSGLLTLVSALVGASANIASGLLNGRNAMKIAMKNNASAMAVAQMKNNNYKKR